MNSKYILVSKILQEFKFKRHRWFRPEKIIDKAAKQREQIKNLRVQQSPIV